jgi:Protein of unknown function (DUF3313)
MINKGSRQLLILALIIFVSGCSVLSLKAPPISESPQVKTLLSSNSTQLKPDEQGLYPFNHTWNSGYCAVEPQTSIYVTPVDTSRIDPANLSSSNLDREDLSAIASYARERLEGAFAEKKENFRVVEEQPVQGRVVELSVVELTGTAVARNVLGTALGALVPGGSLISIRSSGTIGVEGVVKEAQTGKPLFIFADRERGKTAPFSFNDFRVLSHARAAIDDWSEQIVEACAAAPGTRIPDSSPITLLPL